MTVTIELPPEIQAEVMALADAQGLPLAEYVQHLLREQVPVRPGAAVSPSERAALWRASVKGLPHTSPLSDEAISRESIYGDRG
jgi:hypothetical protein